MIFVTVGTHEQSFNRLVECVDNLKRDGLIDEEVIIQIGYCTYEPKYCTWKKLFPYKKMVELVDKARIVITHGGPSSFIMPLQVGKLRLLFQENMSFMSMLITIKLFSVKLLLSEWVLYVWSKM